jgi:hypothetical protein
LSVEEVLARIKKVHQVMEQAMVEGHHYGKIPGTDKPTLLKPGAELLDVMFRLDPQYEVETIRTEHLTIVSTCTLWHIPTGQRWGSGMGSCSTRESKYAFRKTKRTCPKCGAEQINKSKFPPRGAPRDTEPGWYCYAKVGGCGAEFAADDPAIIEQPTGRVPNEDLADMENTVLKMANKRSLVAAVLNVTAASDIFTQDLEDLAGAGEEAVSSPKPAEGPARESSDEQARRLFPDEPMAKEEQPTFEEAEKYDTLGHIEAGFAKLKLNAGEQIAVWNKHTGSAPFLDATAVSLDALTMLLEELRTRHLAQESRKK